MVMGSERSLTIEKANEAIQTIQEAANSEIEIIFGVRIEEALGDKVLVSVIATGLEKAKQHNTASTISNQSISTLTQEVNIDSFRVSGHGSTHADPEAVVENTDSSSTSLDTQERVFESLSLLDDEDDDDDISSLLG